MKNRTLFKENFIFAVILTALYIVYIFVLSPIYTEICSDVIYIETYLPYILELLMEICQLLIWCHLFSHLISHFCLKSRSVFVFVFTAVLTAFRYFLEPVLALTLADDPTYLFADAAIYFISDALQLTAVAVLSAVLIDGSADIGGLKHFGKISSRNLSRVRLTAIVSALLISAVRIGMRIRFDIFYGAPESLADLMWMIAYYTADIVYGFVSYLLIITFVKKICKGKDSV